MNQGLYNISAISDWFLSKQAMTHKKLQKLCYYTQAWGYTLLDTKIIDDDFEAWRHGPVSPVLYEVYKGSGWKDVLPINSQPAELDEKTVEILESVYETYGDLSGNALEALTHSETPWINARIGLNDFDNGNKKIDYNEMKKYYSSVYIGND